MSEAEATAIERLEAVAGSSRDPDGRVFAPIAEILREEGRLVEARTRVEEGTARDPEFASGHMVAARVYADLGLDEEARGALTRVLELDPGNAEAAALADALAVVDEEEAVHWARAQGAEPTVEVADEEVLTITMGDLYLRQGAADRAVSLFERMSLADPENVVLQARLAEARAAMGSPASVDEGIHPVEDPRSSAEEDQDASSTSVEGDPFAEAVTDPATEAVTDPATDPVDVADLGPAVVPVASLAPEAVNVQTLAPEEGPGGSEPATSGDTGPKPAPADGAPEGDVDDFMAWLDDQ